MKKIIKSFSLLLVCTFIMALFTFKPVSANFDSAKNYTTVAFGTKKINNGDSTTNYLSLKITVRYQRGFDQGSSVYIICKGNFDNANDCSATDRITDSSHTDGNFTFATGSSSEYISSKPAKEADKKITTNTFEVDTGVELKSSERENYYTVFVRTLFCSVREEGYNACKYWHNPAIDEGESNEFVKVSFKIGDALGTNITDIGDEGINNVMNKITNIVNDIVLPIIWAVLGLFLIIKGAILGTQIVKAADEPQVRQEKISSLKWLVIGVTIAYAASGLVGIITGFFSNAFNF